jgi:pyruvate dehydrogenase E1 component beta subunit
MRSKTYLQAVNDALHDILEQDKQAFLIGEDVGVYGGGFGATKGLIEAYPDQVLETPISEAAITGVAIGAAMSGKKPILEIQFSDFLTVAIDQIVNQAAKIHFMTGGQTNVPMVVRAASGSGTGAGPQHSQSLENWFAHVPGLKVAMPSNPVDAYAILQAAVKDPNPVLVFEPKSLYKKTWDIPDAYPELELGQSKVVQEGSDITIIATGRMVPIAQEYATQSPYKVEIVDPITLQPLDIDGIAASANKTGRVLILTEAVAKSGISSEILAQLFEAGFRGQAKRLGSRFMPVSAAREMELAQIPTLRDIEEAVERLMHG